MVTIYRGGGFRVVIYTNDHDPAHVHVFHGSGEAKVNLLPDPVDLEWAAGLTRARVRAAVALVQENREEFLTRWSVIHG